MRKRSQNFELVLLGGGFALYWLAQNIFGNLFYAYIKQEFEKYTGLVEADVLAKFAVITPSLILAIGIVWGLHRYIYRQLSDEKASEKQAVIDELSSHLSWAIHNLLNRKSPSPDGIWKQKDREILIHDIDVWCNQITTKLKNRAVFTHSDEVHFDKLGFIQPVTVTGFPDLDHHMSMLKLKFQRLREIIDRRQQ
jgi:hypothetical protein